MCVCERVSVTKRKIDLGAYGNRKKCDKKEFLNTPRIFSKLKILFKAECKLKAKFVLPLYFHLEAVKRKLKLNC